MGAKDGSRKGDSRGGLAFGKLSKEPPDLPEYETRRCLNLMSESELNRNIVDYIADCVLAMGFKEDNFFSNLRIAITGIACSVGIYVVGRLTYPQDAFLLGAMVVAFFALLGGLFVVEGLYLRTAIINIYGCSGERLCVEGWVDRQSNSYMLGIKSKARASRTSVYLGELFDTAGYLVPATLHGKLVELMTCYDTAKLVPPGEKTKVS